METWLVIYDIRNEKRLRRIAKLMEQYGERVQKSVFESMCGQETIQKMRKQAQEILQKEDSLIVIRLCNKCWQKKEQYGVKTEGIGQYRQYEIL